MYVALGRGNILNTKAVGLELHTPTRHPAARGVRARRCPVTWARAVSFSAFIFQLLSSTTAAFPAARELLEPREVCGGWRGSGQRLYAF